MNTAGTRESRACRRRDPPSNVKAGKLITLSGALRSVAMSARRRVSVTILQKVGSRWVPRRSVFVRTTPAGVFAVSYRVPTDRRGLWRARAVFAGGAAERPATSPFAAFTAR